jgi:transcriptional regulator GlxA family with amidase domain
MHRISYVLPGGFQVMALATQAVFEFANLVAGEPFYEVTCHSMPGGSVKSSLGTSLQTRPFTARSTADTWMVVGVTDPLATPSPSELNRPGI